MPVSADLGVGRLLAKSVRDPETECWEWQASLNNLGYSIVYYDGRTRLGHRLIYKLMRGDPGDLTLDHLCRNRACVNPDHLEPVTMKENTLRGAGPSARNAQKTHCPHGHKYTPENTRFKWCRTSLQRVCRECERKDCRERARRRRAERRAAT